MSLEHERIGLCAACVHARTTRSDRGSVFLRCAAAAHDPRLSRYPRLPVLACHAFEQDPGAGPDGEAPTGP